MGMPSSTLRCLDVLDRGPERRAGRQIERKRDCRKYALVIDGQRGVGRLVVREGAERNQFAGVGWDVNRA